MLVYHTHCDSCAGETNISRSDSRGKNMKKCYKSEACRKPNSYSPPGGCGEQSKKRGNLCKKRDNLCKKRDNLYKKRKVSRKKPNISVRKSKVSPKKRKGTKKT